MTKGEALANVEKYMLPRLNMWATDWGADIVRAAMYLSLTVGELTRWLWTDHADSRLVAERAVSVTAVAVCLASRFSNTNIWPTFAAVIDELDRAEQQWPDWPDDLVHAVAIGVEETGETVQAAIDHVYKGSPLARVREEAIQTAAMGLRLLINLPEDPE